MPNLSGAPGNMQAICIITADGISREFYGPALTDDKGHVAEIAQIAYGPEMTLQQVLMLLSYTPKDHETCN